jgi:hypothetical protein
MQHGLDYPLSMDLLTFMVDLIKIRFCLDMLKQLLVFQENGWFPLSG